MIGKRAESILNKALATAVESKHEFLTLEHVMLMLLEETEVVQAVEHCKGNVSKFKEDLKYIYIGKGRMIDLKKNIEFQINDPKI